MMVINKDTIASIIQKQNNFNKFFYDALTI